MNLQLLHRSKCLPDPGQPRTDLSLDGDRDLVASIRENGIKVPLIGFPVSSGIMIADGHRRLAASNQLGLNEIPVIVWPQRPTEGELLLTQLSINGHRAALNSVDEFKAFARLIKLNNWSATELAQRLGINSTEVTRVMAIGKLSEDEQLLFQQGKIQKSFAYPLSRLPPDQRAAMLSEVKAGGITRAQIERQIRRPKQSDEVRARRASCKVPGGAVSVQLETELDLTKLIDVLESLLRECRKLRTKGLNISTALRVLSDQCEISPAT